MSDRYERIKTRQGPEDGQALWEKTKDAYLAEGLCPSCAASAAWGHYSGFATIAPPCPVCTPIVGDFQVPVDALWRRPLDIHKLASKRPREPKRARGVPQVGADPK